MTDPRVLERLRQEVETFDQRKAHSDGWYKLQLSVVAAVLVLLLVIAVISGIVVLHPGLYPPDVVKIAAGTLFGELVVLVVTICKLVLQHGRPGPLEPLTIVDKAKSKAPRQKAMPS